MSKHDEFNLAEILENIATMTEMVDSLFRISEAGLSLIEQLKNRAAESKDGGEPKGSFLSSVSEFLGKVLNAIDEDRGVKFVKVNGELKVMPSWAEVGSPEMWVGDQVASLIAIDNIAKRLNLSLEQDPTGRKSFFFTEERKVIIGSTVEQYYIDRSSGESFISGRIRINSIVYTFVGPETGPVQVFMKSLSNFQR